jgi:hypothetical protein
VGGGRSFKFILGDVSKEGEQRRISMAESVEEWTIGHGGVVVTTPRVKGGD